MSLLAQQALFLESSCPICNTVLFFLMHVLQCGQVNPSSAFTRFCAEHALILPSALNFVLVVSALNSTMSIRKLIHPMPFVP